MAMKPAGRRARNAPGRYPWLPVAFIATLGTVVLIALQALPPLTIENPQPRDGWNGAPVANNGGTVNGIAAGPDGPVAFGSGIWRTTTGTEWTRDTAASATVPGAASGAASP